jgi:hypothetical protein
VEIILCGDETGVGEAAAELGVRHVPDVRRSEHGTPLLDSVFRAASSAARSPLLGYVNTDIILFPDFSTPSNACRQTISWSAAAGTST